MALTCGVQRIERVAGADFADLLECLRSTVRPQLGERRSGRAETKLACGPLPAGQRPSGHASPGLSSVSRLPVRVALKVAPGKRVCEVEPKLDWDKARPSCICSRRLSSTATRFCRCSSATTSAMSTHSGRWPVEASGSWSRTRRTRRIRRLRVGAGRRSISSKTHRGCRILWARWRAEHHDFRAGRHRERLHARL